MGNGWVVGGFFGLILLVTDGLSVGSREVRSREVRGLELPIP
ncbi:hypothetical protein M595_2649 [Lyngbya aestuarii BL J]|uniref:Uncharacterized protein n=1 Tax=Lyngbya aestuarii BL J TaxID=1348334 RepID=U7QLV3_9CYAN|nr:hypothetical protein [Lyngbya aestuarii]ERT07376.1 hypothetical protein M595_2649 [Lyngbya aestuarii BL J]